MSLISQEQLLRFCEEEYDQPRRFRFPSTFRRSCTVLASSALGTSLCLHPYIPCFFLLLARARTSVCQRYRVLRRTRSRDAPLRDYYVCVLRARKGNAWYQSFLEILLLSHLHSSYCYIFYSSIFSVLKSAMYIEKRKVLSKLSCRCSLHRTSKQSIEW